MCDNYNGNYASKDAIFQTQQLNKDTWGTDVEIII